MLQRRLYNEKVLTEKYGITSNTISSFKNCRVLYPGKKHCAVLLKQILREIFGLAMSKNEKRDYMYLFTVKSQFIELIFTIKYLCVC